MKLGQHPTLHFVVSAFVDGPEQHGTHTVSVSQKGTVGSRLAFADIFVCLEISNCVNMACMLVSNATREI
jgi:hypothetical protein